MPFSAYGKEKNTFTFYLKHEPQSLDPLTATSGESNYLAATLFRGLTRYTSDGIVEFDLASNCRYIIDTDLHCKLRDGIKWSDGKEIIADDFVRSFKRFLDPKSPSYVASVLSTVKEVKVLSKKEIQFLFFEPDREFLDKISHPLFAPYINDQVFSGPYKVVKIEKGKRWYLENNSFYKHGSSKRPPIEIIFVSDDATAISLYEKGMIDFLWRVTTSEVTRLKTSSEFFQVPVNRFDYIGFNQRPGHIFADKSLRKKMAQSVNFDEFQKVLLAFGKGGCVGLQPRILDDEGHSCQEFKPEASKVTIDEIGDKKIIFNYSLLGGDDVLNQAVFFQNQWEKNAGIKVNLKGLEQKTMIRELKENPPDVFRKGISLTRPSCLAALEYFKSDNPENFTGFKSKFFDDMIKPLSTRKFSRREKENICAAAVDFLFKREYVGIPLGKTYFTMMLSKNFKGLKINDINQLDLSELEYVGK
jgi:oligopeptide transport system substrate-binding protein